MSKKAIAIYGPPGTGKTRRLMDIMAKLKDERHIPSHEIGFFAFTRAAADEAKRRLNVTSSKTIRTLHSLAYEAAQVSKVQVVDTLKLRQFGDFIGIPMNGKSAVGFENVEEGDEYMGVHNYAVARQIPVTEAFDQMPGLALDRSVAEMVSKSYTQWKRSFGWVDFNDMILRYLADPIDVGAKYLFLDEAQDLSPLQWSMVDGLAEHAECIWLAGDDDQCQPWDTLVDTPEGKRFICDIEDGGTVTAYNSSKGHFGPRTVRKSCRMYRGPMARVTVAGKNTRCTPNHKWLVRWNRSDTSKAVVYIMRLGDKYRLGWCQLFRADGCLHLNTRANTEKADAVWVLRLCDSREEASKWESVLAARYGVPTSVFQPVAGTNQSQEHIDFIFANVDSRAAAQRAFAAHDLHEELPLINRKERNFSRGGSANMVIHAANLLPGVMQLPVRAGEKVEWAPLSIEWAPAHEIVYSLDVADLKLYVADGIVTHNSIYEWSGADPHGMMRYHYEGNQRILDQSYRVPQLVHAIANRVIRRVGQRVEKRYKPREERGTVRRYGDLDPVAIPKGDTLMLYRNHTSRREIEAWLMEHAIPYTAAGPFPSHFQGKWANATRAWFKLRRGEHLNDAALQLVARIAPGVAANISRGDFRFAKDAPSRHFHGVPEDVAAYLSRVDLNLPPTTRISTIHASKGAEADRVILMNAMGERTYEEMNDSEHRVWYVAVTRARHQLDIVDGANAYDL